MSDILTVTEITTQPSTQSDVETAASSAGFKAIPELTSVLKSRAHSIEATTGLIRAPFMFTRIGRKEGIYTPSGGADFSVIYAELNPSQYGFILKTREVLEKCGGGEVLHSFQSSAERADRLGAYLDEVPFSYTLNTGNCIPVRIGWDGEIRIPGGLDTLYALTELLLEDPRILPDGRSNDLIIIQTSVVYPSLTIEGKLDPGGINGLNLDAGEPLEIRGYSFTVSARRITPRITNHAALQAEYLSTTFGQQVSRRRDLEIPKLAGEPIISSDSYASLA